MDQTLLDRILRSPKLPTIPAIAMRILDLTQDVNMSVQDLAATIEHDQAIAAKVLRTVNSSFYGLRRPCTNINQALVMLGMSTVKTLALSFSLVSSLRCRSSGDFDHIAYWRRSVYSAAAARLIAREACLPNADEAFLGALLQDIGMMAMYQALGESYLAIVKAAPDHSDLAALELAELELQHADIGAMLAQRWKLPAELIIAIKYHGQPSASPVQHEPLVRSVGLANIACDALTARHPGPALRRFLDCAAGWFQLPADAAEHLLRQITAAAQQVSSLFALKIGETVDADAILIRAQHQLTMLREQVDLADDEEAPICRLASDSKQFDPLTGALTRRAMLTTSLDIFDGPHVPEVAAIALEVDGFHELLESFEQTDADAVLVETASTLDQHFGPLGAHIARWESALFIIIAPGLDHDSAIAAVERALQALRRQAPGWIQSRAPRAISWSAGVAFAAGAAGSGIDIITRAINALDGAKRAGGNCTHPTVQRLAA